MTTEQLLDVEIMLVEFGRQLTVNIRHEFVEIHQKMIGLHDNEKLEELSDRRFHHRKDMKAVLHCNRELYPS